MKQVNKQIIDLSIFSILKFFLVVIALAFLYFIKEVLAVIFVSLIFASAVDPWVDKLEKIKFPRWLSILLIYLGFFLIVFLVVFLLIPPILQQFGQLAENFPQYFEQLSSWFGDFREFSNEHGVVVEFGDSITAIKANLSQVITSVFSTIFDVFGGILSFFVILVITFYMTVEESAIKRSVTFILPDKYRPFIMQLIEKVQKKIGSWLKGQLILCLIVGLMSYVGLLILGVNYALILALVAAVGEFIPYVGPVLASVPAIFLAFAQSPVKALFVLILYVIIQQLENNVLVPKVMQKAVGLNPIVSIVALLIGVKVAGFVGVVLAIPVATAVSVVTKEFWKSKEAIEKVHK